MTHKFSAKLVVELEQDDDGRPVLRHGALQWRIHDRFSYEVKDECTGEIIFVPRKYLTDFSSIPKMFWNIEPPAGMAAKAAVIHDYLYVTKGDCFRTRLAPYTRAEADAIFSEAMSVLGVPAWKRTMMYLAVRAAGWKGWGT